MNLESFFFEELEHINESLRNNNSEYDFKREIPLYELVKFCISEEIYYFESKDEDFKFLGIGRAKTIPKDAINDYINAHPKDYLVYQGLFEKDSEPICYLPEWVFISKDNKTTLKINESSEDGYLPMSEDQFEINFWKDTFTKWNSLVETPNYHEWSGMIEKACQYFEKGELEKVVLSRKRVYNYESIVDPKSLFINSYLSNLTSSHFSVFYQTNYNEAFVSYTPERLVCIRGKELETIALAGSTQRGKTPEEDVLFEEELKNSPKLIHEHSLVAQYIKEKIGPLSSNLNISELFTMKLPYIQHREALIKATLKSDVGVTQIIDLLHPTPAVGGLPLDRAYNVILELENSKRDYYAAPTGVLSKQYSEIAVGIRSAYLRNDSIVVFGGAGIVAGSKSEEEWNETGAKMRPFTQIINKTSF